MRLSDIDILIIPDGGQSQDDDWQMRWLKKFPTARLIAPCEANGSELDYRDWSERIIAAATEAAQPVILVSHGRGIGAVLKAAPKLPAGKVAGAFLVAMHDLDDSLADLPESANLSGQTDKHETDAVLKAKGLATAAAHARGSPAVSLPLDKLPFPAVLIASANCPHCTLERARYFAEAWGATLVEAGEVGSLNSASGHGPWPEGLMRFGAFLKTLS